MTSCAGYVLVKRHPEIHYLIVRPAGDVSMSGAWSMSASAFVWTIVARPTGSKSSHVELRSQNAKPEELKEIWEVIEGCAKR